MWSGPAPARGRALYAVATGPTPLLFTERPRCLQGLVFGCLSLLTLAFAPRLTPGRGVGRDSVSRLTPLAFLV